MAGSHISHAAYKGPSVVKEILIGIALGIAAGGLWKMHHWNNQRRTKEFYDLLDKDEISVVVNEGYIYLVDIQGSCGPETVKSQRLAANAIYGPPPQSPKYEQKYNIVVNSDAMVEIYPHIIRDF